MSDFHLIGFPIGETAQRRTGAALPKYLYGPASVSSLRGWNDAYGHNYSLLTRLIVPEQFVEAAGACRSSDEWIDLHMKVADWFKSRS